MPGKTPCFLQKTKIFHAFFHSLLQGPKPAGLACNTGPHYPCLPDVRKNPKTSCSKLHTAMICSSQFKCFGYHLHFTKPDRPQELKSKMNVFRSRIFQLNT